MSIKFQLVSDIHSEFYKTVNEIPEITPYVDYLILAGDIGKPFCQKFCQFLSQTCEKFKKVFYVAGNHEYYSTHKSYLQIEDKLRELSNKIPNLVYLQNETYNLEIENKIITVAGTTLWSYIPPEYTNRIEYSISDYYNIKSSTKKRIHVLDTNKWHQKNIEWIKELLETNQYPILMITHHSPVFNRGECPPQYKNSPINVAYATDLTNLIKKPIIHWVYGHCHWKNEIVVNNITVSSNPMGYKNEITGYQPNYTFEVEA